MMKSGEIGFLNYQGPIIMIRKKADKRIDMMLNLKLINLLKIGELVQKLQDEKQIENSLVMTMNIRVIEKPQVSEVEL